MKKTVPVLILLSAAYYKLRTSEYSPDKPRTNAVSSGRIRAGDSFDP